MPHFRIDPLRELESLSQRMKKFVDDFPETFSVDFGKGFEPRIDVVLQDTSVLVYVELPAVKKSDLSISLKDGTITVSGNKLPEYAVESASVPRSERAFGAFSRSIELPCEVHSDKVKAELSDGVLQITLERKVASAPKEHTIEIH